MTVRRWCMLRLLTTTAVVMGSGPLAAPAAAAPAAAAPAAAAPAAAAPAAAASSAAVAPTPRQLVLPAPTGPHRVGTVSLHLRVPGRELMISLWYPSDTRADGHAAAPWLPPPAAVRVLTASGLDPAGVVVPLTHGHVGAPVRTCDGPLPVVLYSPGND